MPGLDQQGDIDVGEGMKMRWLEGPDGNMLSLFEGSGG